MPLRPYLAYAFDTDDGGQTINQELDPLDLSRCDLIRVTVKLSKAITDTADTFDVYLQCRGPDGKWEDRIHFSQLLGDLSPTVADPEILVATLQQFGTLGDDEEESEPSGSAGGSRLSAGSVRNGAFPGRYHDGTAPAASWRVQLVVVDADADADFEGTIYVEGNSPL